MEQPGAHADRQQGQVQEEESEITQVKNMTSFCYTCRASCSHLGLFPLKLTLCMQRSQVVIIAGMSHNSPLSILRK